MVDKKQRRAALRTTVSVTIRRDGTVKADRGGQVWPNIGAAKRDIGPAVRMRRVQSGNTHPGVVSQFTRLVYGE